MGGLFRYKTVNLGLQPHSTLSRAIASGLRNIPDHLSNACKLADHVLQRKGEAFKRHLQLHAEELLATSDKDRLNDMHMHNKQNGQEGNKDVGCCGMRMGKW